MEEAYGGDRWLYCLWCVSWASRWWISFYYWKRKSVSYWLGASMELTHFGIWLLPSMLTWHLHSWSFESKSSIQPSGRAGGLPVWGQISKSSFGLASYWDLGDSDSGVCQSSCDSYWGQKLHWPEMMSRAQSLSDFRVCLKGDRNDQRVHCCATRIAQRLW